MISTRMSCLRCLLRLLTIIVLLISLFWCTTVASPIKPLSTSRRWIYPCSGRHLVIHSTEVAADDVTHAPTDLSTTVTETVDLISTFRALSKSAKRLKRRVGELKTLYIHHRFRDEATVINLDQMGLMLEGMPDVHQPTLATINDADMTTVVHRAFEHLARVAVFINQARIGEALAANEPISFENDFERIEDHHRDGLYWLLCAVQTVIGRTSQPTIEPEVTDAILRMRVVVVDRNSMRHTRDYLVLRDFERLLDRLSIEFAALGRLSALGQGSIGRLSASSMTTLEDDSSVDHDEEVNARSTGSGSGSESGSSSTESVTNHDHDDDRDDDRRADRRREDQIDGRGKDSRNQWIDEGTDNQIDGRGKDQNDIRRIDDRLRKVHYDY